MKNYSFFALILFCAVLFCAACSDGSNSSETFITTDAPEMIRVETNNAEIVVGADVQTNTTSQTVKPFEMSKYEVNYNLWRGVYKWATSSERGEKKYTFQNPGSEGSFAYYTSSSCVKTFFNEGGEPRDEGIPVAGINWRDAMVWCNALSECSGLSPVYFSDAEFKKPYRNSILATSTSALPNYFPFEAGSALIGDETSSAKGGVDNPFVDERANGYRLPYVREWEWAARKTSDGFISGKNAPGDTSGSAFASDENHSKQLYKYGWSQGQNFNTGTRCSSKDDGPANTAAGWNDTSGALKYAAAGNYRMHKQGGLLPTGLGFFDMAGNAAEWVFDLGKNTPFNNGAFCYSHVLKSSVYYATWNENFQSSYQALMPSNSKVGGLRLAKNAE